MSRMVRIVAYIALGLGLFMAGQSVVNWVNGIDYNPHQTIYRTRVVYREKEPDKLHKDEKRTTLECVPIQAIVRKDHVSVNKEGQSVQTQVTPSLATQTPESIPVPRELLTHIFPSEEVYPLLLNRWTLKEPFPNGLVLEVNLHEDGSTSLRYYARPQSILELGKQRRFDLWVGIQLAFDRSRYSDLKQATLDYSFDASFTTDLFRVMNSWIRFRSEVGYSTLYGINTKVQLGKGKNF